MNKLEMFPSGREEFKIAIICALTLEAEAVEELFDETYDKFGKRYGKLPGDNNAYINGRIESHNIVLCYMPGMGKGSAASVASSLKVSYTEIQVVLTVGICGGAPYPSPDEQIFLGDVIISDAVVEYDFGGQYPGGFQRKSGTKEALGRPNQEIRSLLAGLKAQRSRKELEIDALEQLYEIQKSQPRWRYPGNSNDVLFESSYQHRHYVNLPCRCFDNMRDIACREAQVTACSVLGCDPSRICRYRSSQESNGPVVHVGTLASADTVMKSGAHRDNLVKSEHVIGFEMEGAGVWDNIPCIVIKGVCDYADSHKNKLWQAYAAATAASTTKAFLRCWRPASSRLPSSDSHLPDIRGPRQAKPLNNQQDREYGERQWENVVQARLRDNECLNCGYDNHYEYSCYLKCGRCRMGGHTQRKCRKPIKCDKCGGQNHMARDC